MPQPQLARDEAGHTWDVSDPSHPVLVQQAQSPVQMMGGIQTKAPNPFEQRTIQAGATTAEGKAAMTEDEKASAHEAAITAHLNNMQFIGDPSKHGKEYLATVPVDNWMHNTIPMVTSGGTQLGSIIGADRNTNQAKVLIAAAKQYDPSWNPSIGETRYAARQDFTGSGGTAKYMESVDRAANALRLIKGASDAMSGSNSGYAPFNRWLAEHQQDVGANIGPAKTFDTMMSEAMGQIATVVGNGGGQTDASRGVIQQGMSPHASLLERNNAINALSNAVGNALSNKKQSWDSAFNGSESIPRWISPQNAAFLEQSGAMKKGELNPYQNTPAPVGSPWVNPPGGGNGGGGNPPMAPTSGNPDSPYSPETTAGLAGILRGGGSVDDANHYLAATADGKGHQVTPNNWASEQKFLADYKSRTGTDYTGPIGAVKSDKPTPAQDAVSAFGLNGGPVGTAAANYFNSAGAGIPGLLAGQGAQANLDQASADNPKSALLGNAAGGVTAMYGGGEGLKALGILKDASPLAEWTAANPIKSSIAGNSVYGGIYGAASDPNAPVTGAAAGMFAGGLGSAAGSGLANVGGKVIKGVTNPAVDYLRSKGVPLTVGEVLGGGWKKAQDASTTIPGVGDMMASRYGEGRKVLNEAAFNIGADPVEQQVNAAGTDGLNALRSIKDQAYTKALAPINLDLNTPKFIQDMGQTIGAAKALPQVGDTSAHAVASLQTNVGGMAPDGMMNGRQFQEGYRGLARDANTRPATAPFNHEFGNVLGQGKQNLVDTLNEQNPGAFGDFLNANKVNRNLSVLTDAVGAAKNQFGEGGNQLFTPAQLNSAATNNATKYDGKLSALTSDDPMMQLAHSGQQVMSNKVNDSGTMSRALALGAVGLLGGGIGGEADGKEGIAPGALLTGGLLAGMNSKIGQKILTAALLKRSQGMGMFGNKMISAAPFAGTALGGAAAGAVPQYLSGF